MPTHGPSGESVKRGAVESFATDKTRAEAVPYILVKLSPTLLQPTGGDADPRFAGEFTDLRGAPGLVIGVGDVLSVTVFESAAGGLFTPTQASGARPGNFVEVPPQIVGSGGRINVPYAGPIVVSGRTPVMVEDEIAKKLMNRAIEPQVVVTLREQNSQQVGVLGDVNAPAKFSINARGERVLDAIARAGGSRYPSYETVVSLQRGGTTAQTSFVSLLRNPRNNIYVQPGDTVVVTREQRHFVALGASGQNGLFFFDSENVTLSYAMGKAGGLLDERAEPSSVFVYRREPRRSLLNRGLDVSRFRAELVPVIYQVDLRDPSGFFLTQNMPLQDRDVVFVANSGSVEFAKLLQFLRIGINGVREGVDLHDALAGGSSSSSN